MPVGSPKVPRETRGSSSRWCLPEPPKGGAVAVAATEGLLLYSSFEMEPRAETSSESTGQMGRVSPRAQRCHQPPMGTAGQGQEL